MADLPLSLFFVNSADAHDGVHRRVTITGDSRSVAMAKQMIQQLIDEAGVGVCVWVVVAVMRGRVRTDWGSCAPLDVRLCKWYNAALCDSGVFPHDCIVDSLSRTRARAGSTCALRSLCLRTRLGW